MKAKTIVPLAVAAVCGYASLGASSCATSQQTRSTPDQPSSSGSTSAPPKRARLGDAITLQGNTDAGEPAMKVTALKVLDPLAAGQYDTPAAGKRYVGIRVRLTNVGSTTYNDAPSNGATLIITGDEQAQSTILSGGECGTDFVSAAKIAPGESQVGCLPFEVAKGKQPKEFQFTLASGFGNQTGEWRLGS